MTNSEELIVELRRKGERALSQNLQDLLDRAANAIESPEPRTVTTVRFELDRLDNT